MDIAGRHVFITGAGGGIGGGIAQAFAEAGAKVTLADLDNSAAQAEARDLPEGSQHQIVSLDVSSLDSWSAAREKGERAFGPIEVLVNNAGISTGFRPITALSPAEFDRVMAVNVRGVYNGVITVLPGMTAAAQGHIVNVSSLNGLLPFGSFATYSASKFAVLGLSDALRQELASQGIGVSTLFPGLTRSRMSEKDALAVAAGDAERAERIRANMMEPVWLGRATVRAVQNNEAYIITHPDSRGALEQRHAEILAAFGEPAQPGYKTGTKAIS